MLDTTSEGFWEWEQSYHTEKVQNQCGTQASWTVPRRRTSRKKGKLLYFASEDGLCLQRDGDISTQNRFDLLTEHQPHVKEDKKKEEYVDIERKKEFLTTRKTKHCILPSYEDFLHNASYFCNPNFFNKYDDVMLYTFDDKINRSCGYLPDFIFLDNFNFDKVYNKSNYPKYYPYLIGGKVIKQVSNSNSRYNNRYFADMKHAYEINIKYGGDLLNNSKRGNINSKRRDMNVHWGGGRFSSYNLRSNVNINIHNDLKKSENPNNTENTNKYDKSNNMNSYEILRIEKNNSKRGIISSKRGTLNGYEYEHYKGYGKNSNISNNKKNLVGSVGSIRYNNNNSNNSVGSNNNSNNKRKYSNNNINGYNNNIPNHPLKPYLSYCSYRPGGSMYLRSPEEVHGTLVCGGSGGGEEEGGEETKT